MKTFYDGQLITASDINANFTEAASMGIAGADLRTFQGASQVVAAGGNSTISITFGETYDRPPLVFPGFATGSGAFKGAISVQTITTTGCALRIDNLGNLSSTIVPCCLVARI